MALFIRVEREGGKSCALDVTLAYEVFTEHKAMMLYPINALRNLARLQVNQAPMTSVDYSCVDRYPGSPSSEWRTPHLPRLSVPAPPQARTPLVALVDIDMLTSKELYDMILTSGSGFRDKLMRDAREGPTAFVIPAFQVCA